MPVEQKLSSDAERCRTALPITNDVEIYIVGAALALSRDNKVAALSLIAFSIEQLQLAKKVLQE